jgi:hypothetical protein
MMSVVEVSGVVAVSLHPTINDKVTISAHREALLQNDFIFCPVY